MKKRILSMLLMLAMVMSVCAVTAEAAPPTSVTVVVNGQTVDFNGYIDANGRTMVPVRAVGYAIGLQDSGIVWDGAAKTATFTGDYNTVVFTVGSRNYTVNGQTKAMNTEAVNQSGSVYVPIRALAESFGYNVSWNNATKTATLTAGVTAYCEPGTYGICATSFAIAVDDVSKYLSVTAADFTIKNAALTDALWSNNLKVTDVSFKQGQVLLTVEPFMLSCSRSDYMFWNQNKAPDENGLQFDFAPGDLTVTCKSSADLSFTYRDIAKSYAAIIDDFTDESHNGTPYKMFTPVDTSKALPLVIWNHGGGCSAYGRQIIDDPFATSFASKQTQEFFPCYVIAPYYEAKSVEGAAADRANIVAAIKELVASGKVDGKRIYVTGQSYGSATSFTYLYENPGFFAAMVAMNGGPTVNEDGSILQGDSNWGNCYDHDALKQIVDNGTAIMLVQGIGDPLSTPDKFAAVYKELQSLGQPAHKLIWNSYTAEQFNFLQGFNVPDTGIPVKDPFTGETTYVASQFHDSNRPAAYDTYVKTWLFQQHQ